MKCTLDRRLFLATYNRAAGFVSAKAIQQPIRNVKFLCSDQPELVATDLQSGIRCSVGGVSVDEPGVVLLSEKFGRIINSCTEDHVTLIVNNDRLIISDQSGKFELPTLDPDTFPDFRPVSFDDSWSIYAQELKTLIRRTTFACDPESTRYALGGCLVELDATKITLVGTDGRCLAKSTFGCSLIGKPIPPKGAVIPERGLKLVDRLLDCTGPVRIAFAGTSVWFETENGIASVQLLEGRFPSYSDVIPASRGDVATMQSEALSAELMRASVVGSEESRGLDLTFADDVLTIKGQSAEIGSAAIAMPITYSGKPITITIDPDFTLPALKSVLGEISIEMTGPKDALQIKADGFHFVQMPLTRDDAKAAAA